MWFLPKDKPSENWGLLVIKNSYLGCKMTSKWLVDGTAVIGFTTLVCTYIHIDTVCFELLLLLLGL